MRILLSLLASFALLGAAQAAADDVHVYVDWRVTIDPQGHVTAMTAAPHERVDKVPAIRARLEQAIHNWQFLPGMVDGKPAETNTGLHLAATLMPASDNSLGIRVDQASVGGTLVTNHIFPRYPAKAIHEQKQGEVVLRVEYDASGKVTSSSLYPGTPKTNVLLVQASQDVVLKWQFTPEIVGGHGVAGSAITPFCYSLGRDRKNECLWKHPGSDDPLREGETLALNPAAKLLTDVAGRML